MTQIDNAVCKALQGSVLQIRDTESLHLVIAAKNLDSFNGVMINCNKDATPQ